MLFSQLSVQGLLSFGNPGIRLKLHPLNVLIGPNGTGKSNLLEIVRLLKSLPTGMGKVLQQGGPGEWLHDGVPSAETGLSYTLAKTGLSGGTRLLTSLEGLIPFVEYLNISGDGLLESISRFDPEKHVLFRAGSKLATSHSLTSYPLPLPPSTDEWSSRNRFQENLSLDSANSSRASVYEQVRGGLIYPEITLVAELFSQIRLYRDWSFGPSNRLRHGFRADELSGDFLEEDASNLASVLHEMRTDREAWDRLLRALRNLYEGCEDIHVSFAGGFVQLHVLEGEKRRKVPASRLSDGTLRYLMLVTLLCHPKPPPLICIEEPELGLHPDLMVTLAELLREASTRTQLIVTTHSEALVDALGDQPEDIVVCERGEQGSTMRRLDEESLREWLKNYSLGQLWRRGDIGGNRW